MFRLILKQTLARRARLALTVVAVTLGVTFVTGALVLTDTAQRAFDAQFGETADGVDLTVRDAVAFDAAMGVEVARDPLPPRLVRTVRSIDGVAHAQPVVEGSGLLEYRDEAIVPRGPSMLSSWAPPPLGAFSLREGRAPEGADEVVIDKATADAYDISLGEPVTVQAERTAQLRVVGLAGFGDETGIPNSTVALVDVPTGQRLLDLGSGVSEVAVTVDDDATVEAVSEQLDQALGSAYEVGSSRDTAAAAAEAAKSQLSYIQVTLLVLAGAALLIGGFLIANTFSIVVTQRTRELAVLRAAGATGRQVVASVLGEALLVGLIGAAAGSGLGMLAASGLRALVRALGVAVPDAGLVLTTRTLLVAVGVGVAVTTVSALGPSRRAAGVDPVAAIRTSEEATVAGRVRRVVAIVGALGAAAATLAGLLGDGSLALVAVGAVATVVTLVACGPGLVPALVGVLGRPLAVLGVPGVMARQAAARSPRRVASTVTALALSLALIAFMAVLGATVRASVDSSYREAVAAELVVESARDEMLGGLVPATYSEVRQLDEVAAVSRLRYGHWKDGDQTQALTAVDPATLPAVTDLHLRDGELTDLEPGGVLLAEGTATDRGLGVGDDLPMTFARSGTEKLRVVGLLDDADAQAMGTDYIIGLRTYRTLFSERMDASLFVKVADGVDVGQAQTAIDRALAEFPTAEVRDQAAAVEGRTTMVDQVIGIVSVLLLFTVLIAMLGITNTLALSIVERTREIGMLRAVGMTRRQLSGMIRGEALLVAAAALVTGTLLGTGYGVAAAAALGRSTPVTLTVPVGSLLGVLLLAAVVGVVAGIAPARRAANLDVLDAIAAD